MGRDFEGMLRRRLDRRVRHSPDFGDKRIATAGQGHNVVWLPRVILERLPQNGHALVQVIAASARVRPDLSDELGAFEDGAGVLQQYEQGIECLGRKRNELVAAQRGGVSQGQAEHDRNRISGRAC